MEDRMRTTQIEKALIDAFSPLHLEVINESGLHKGHAGDDGSGESHFKVVVVSDSFAGISRVTRHRMIYSVLEKELSEMPHALSVQAFSGSEFL